MLLEDLVVCGQGSVLATQDYSICVLYSPHHVLRACVQLWCVVCVCVCGGGGGGGGGVCVQLWSVCMCVRAWCVCMRA